MKAYQRGGLDGIGFVLHREKDEEGKEKRAALSAWTSTTAANREAGEIAAVGGLEIIRELDTYPEASPSGEGVRSSLWRPAAEVGRRATSSVTRAGDT